ncbi:hypothetical protein [Rudanella lutea]|jgi:hypothetical protein|uniref:hypothetical protein n=1 Tax=Rudanella lutea TaxID=451374 RepID=UPI00037E9415|nr:hypothetical protein [Rudanella lutea]
MRNPFFYVLLLVLVVLDAWLLANPNLIGRVGVFLFEYDYISTFPRALGTVAGVTAVALLLGGAARRFFKRPIAIILLAMLTIAGLIWLVQSVGQFTTGVYKLTGAGFKAGAMLLPGLVVLVFGKTFYDALTQNRGIR